MRKASSLDGDQKQELLTFVANRKITKKELQRAIAILVLEEPLISINLTGISRKYALKLKKKYEEKGLLGIKEKEKKVKETLTKSQREEVKITLSKSPTESGHEEECWTTGLVIDHLKEKYDVRYKSRTSIYILLKESKLTFHKPGQKYDKYNQSAVDKWKEENICEINEKKNDENVVFLVSDEMILTNQTTTQKVWLPTGKYPEIECKTTRDRRCIYGFLNLKNGVQHAFKYKFCNAEETINSLKEIDKIYPPEKQIYLLWDNASWHKAEIVKKFLEDAPKGRWLLRNFPTYSPQLNPQEHVWKKGRSKISHNVFIKNIDESADKFINYLNAENFNYAYPC